MSRAAEQRAEVMVDRAKRDGLDFRVRDDCVIYMHGPVSARRRWRADFVGNRHAIRRVILRRVRLLASALADHHA